VPRRILVLLALALVFAANAAGDVGHRKAAVDAKISHLQSKLAAARAHEGALKNEISSVTAQIRTLEARVGDVSSKLAVLQQDLALHQRRLDTLNELFLVQTNRYNQLRHDYAAAVSQLDQRLIEIYKDGSPSVVAVLFDAKSVNELVDQITYYSAVAQQDKEIAGKVRVARRRVRTQREQTRVVRDHLAGGVGVRRQHELCARTHDPEVDIGAEAERRRIVQRLDAVRDRAGDVRDHHELVDLRAQGRQ